MKKVVTAYAILIFVTLTGAISRRLIAQPNNPHHAMVEEYFEKLKKVPANYTVFGSICEQLGKLELMRVYPQEHYDIAMGLNYLRQGRVLGELDLVVFRKHDREAILIAEVKCWRNLSAAKNKAIKQLKRFQFHIATPTNLKIHSSAREDEVYHPMQFDENRKYILMSQKGGETAGFDQIIPLDLEQINLLLQRILACQGRGECPRANR